MHIRERGNGKYQIIVSAGIDPITNNRITKSMTYIPQGKNKKERDNDLNLKAAEFEKQVIERANQLKQGAIIEADTMTFREFLPFWDSGYAKKVLSIRTREDYIRIIKSDFLPVLGNIPMKKISVLNLNAIYDEMESRGLTSGTIRKRHSVVRTVFNYACDIDLMRDNISRNVKLPKKKIDTTLHFFDAKQAKTFLSLFEREHIQYRIYFNIALYGGFRRGEMIALTWNDIDFKNHIIRISKSATVTNDQGQIIKSPKSRAGYRSVNLPEFIFDLLRQWRKQQMTLYMQMANRWNFIPDSFDDNYIFIQMSNGKMMHLDTPYGKMKKVIKAYNSKVENESDKLPMIRLHDLRHTSATFLISQGMDIETIAHRLGHSQPSLTMNVYGHCLPPKDKQAAELLSNMLA